MPKILQIASAEWKFMRTNPFYLCFLIAAPVLFIVSLGLMYSPRKVQHVPVLIVDQDHSRISRELIQAILANETFSLGGYSDSVNDFEPAVAEDRAHACFVFPKGLENNLLSHRSARIDVQLDHSNYLAGSAQLSAATNILATYSVGIETHMLEAGHGTAWKSALRSSTPFEIGSRMLYNPAFNANYLNFMVSGFVYVAWQLMALLIVVHTGTASVISKHLTTLSNIQFRSLVLYCGRIIPYLLFACVMGLILIYLPHWCFAVPLYTASFDFWFIMLWEMLMLVTLGYGLSCITRDPLYTTELCAILTLPNFLLSGYTWPILAMPKAIAVLAYIFPMGPVALMERKISFMGGSLADCSGQIGGLIGWTLIATVLAVVGTKRTISASPIKDGHHV